MSISVQKAFGDCIREQRRKLGLSQEKFALKIGMDRTYYASVESGKRNLSIANIEKIADGFGISLSELFLSVDKRRRNINESIFNPHTGADS